MSWFVSVWISMQSSSSKTHDVAIVRKLEQSTSFPVGHHCKSLNNAKQTPNKSTVFYKSNDLTWLFPGNCFPHRLQSPECRADEHYRGKELTGIYLVWIAALWDLTVDYRTRSRSHSELVRVSGIMSNTLWIPESVNNFWKFF